MEKVYFLCIAMLVLLSSCSSDDNNNGSNISTAEIVGIWIGESVDYSGTGSTIFQGETITANFDGEGFDIDYTLTFTENPNNVVANGSYSVVLDYTINGQTEEQIIEDLEFLNNGTWNISGDMLTIVSEGETSDVEILELTDSSLKLKLTEEEIVIEQGLEVDTNITLIMTFTK